MKYTIVHCSHHKTGTVWFHNVLKRIASKANKSYRMSNKLTFINEIDIFHQDKSRVNKNKFGVFKGSHIIRDPRAVVVSGYFYHKRTDEKWVKKPNKKYGGLSYQDYLNSLDLKEGLCAEIKRCSETSVRDMIEWDYKDPRFIELKYEELMADPEGGFRSVFKHYGFDKQDVNSAVHIALENTITTNPKLLDSEHVTSGKVDKWKEVIVGDVKEYFKIYLGESLIKLGYEKTNDW